MGPIARQVASGRAFGEARSVIALRHYYLFFRQTPNNPEACARHYYKGQMRVADPFRDPRLPRAARHCNTQSDGKDSGCNVKPWF